MTMRKRRAVGVKTHGTDQFINFSGPMCHRFSCCEEPVKGKGKGKSKAKKEEKIEAPKGKAKSKGKGEAKEEPKGKGKSKGKEKTPKPEPKGKGKGKGTYFTCLKRVGWQVSDGVAQRRCK